MVPAADVRFTRVYTLHYDQVLAYAGRRVGRTDAEDVANDVFAVLWRRLDEVDAETELAWLYGVAYRTIGRSLRSVKRRQSLIDRVGGLGHSSSDLPDQIVVRREQDRAVLETLAGMQPKDAEVLRLSIWEEFTARQIAVVVDCSPDAAKQRLSRARKRLAKKLSSRVPAIASSESAEKGGSQ
jgi:RNA polymerase sigma-70 factor (ECF subfamily)